MQHALEMFGQVAHHIIQNAASGAQHAAQSQHAARIAAAHAALAQKKVKAEAEEAESADDLVAGAAVSVKAVVSTLIHLSIAAVGGPVNTRHELLICFVSDFTLFCRVVMRRTRSCIQITDLPGMWLVPHTQTLL